MKAVLVYLYYLDYKQLPMTLHSIAAVFYIRNITYNTVQFTIFCIHYNLDNTVYEWKLQILNNKHIYFKHQC